MINLVQERNPMPTQDPDVRTKNFLEVCEGYTEDMAVREAMRCLKCRKKPCMTKGCPVQMNIPEFIAKVAEGEFEEAYQIIRGISCLPSVCSRVCPQENQCEGSCVRGIKGEPVAIGRLERFVCDWHEANCGKGEIVKAEANGHKVAVIGAGPAGIACAGDLADRGYDVTVYEALHQAGGVLLYGIPQFRLPKEIVAAEVAKLEAKGVKFVMDAVAGKTFTVDDLMKKEGFEAVFIGTGAEEPYAMNIPGEDLNGVYSANDYLTRVNMAKANLTEEEAPAMNGGTAIIVGGGNVAMDAARCAKRMGADEVRILYRRSREEMPACNAEIEEAEEEGIVFQFLTNPVAVKGDADGKVSGVEVVSMKLGEPDASGRRRPIAIEGSNEVIPAAMVILAIGTKPGQLILDATEKLEADKSGQIITDAETATNRPGIYAGGDAVTGPATVVKAMGAGKKAAASIDEYLSK
ncbi:MAG: NADPH-dependent glutamate synthase [Firmicutes bacterium]|nr:NADPH-dependent glutamate synthase [Bacillota bacterium]MDD7602677.1 NADPH-dependent glutamate synthase [Bacillota bacterium]MDY5855438.1 NADPH-dependent glutamate synthase [Anaerovoracaceae bacterium]